MRPPDAVFADPRLAVLYDALDPDRSDLEAYVSIVEELGSRHVVDVGCGTGSLAVLLAERGIGVVGVDPAAASLAIARTKPYADRVTWVHGDATALRPATAGAAATPDLVVMTGNVAQVFVADDDWHATLTAIAHTLRPGGWLVLETRRADARAWETWDVPPTTVDLPDGTRVVVSRTVTEVAPPLVTFTSTTEVDGERLGSTSTLRFRDLPDLETDLDDHGFALTDVRDAPDRPGLEHVLLARRR